MTKTVPYLDTTKVTLENGKWYAFELDGRQFYATVYNNGFTGCLELTEIPDPYICSVCGNSYSAGNHFQDGRTEGAHNFYRDAT